MLWCLSWWLHNLLSKHTVRMTNYVNSKQIFLQVCGKFKGDGAGATIRDVILAPAGNLISAPRLRLRNTTYEQMQCLVSGKIIRIRIPNRSHYLDMKTTLVQPITVLRIRNVYHGSRILIFTHPGSRIPDPKTSTKERGKKNLLSYSFL
jgi:hypothetical protein